ncbi:Ribbon-helix-helix domain-containing protein [Sphingobium sp. AP50]|uniref:ribbon-helix-helix domain-containing protein n=1 Tax=Sphingobium sp. AP50 TaxID=1884369 RepID=UPI0008BF45C7|nr:ribbon-helix-helix domain-containing protein [Sphingobium sp. AP50]SEK02226.1 Ribbon-helix-helix domain-containing protein [Sphingobium sp. AP50]
MTIKQRRFTVRLEQDQWERLEQQSRNRGLPAADLIRAAVDLLLSGNSMKDMSRLRLARIGEFQHLALDVILREQFPQYRERIVAETDKRVELYHGA